MATIHLAIDAEAGLTLPAGQIVGLSDSLQGLRDAGFSNSPYNGNRRTTIDDAASGWNSDVVPGWMLRSRTSATVYELGPNVAISDLEDMRNAIRDLQAQVIAWSRELNDRAVGQPRAKVRQGHDRLYSGLCATYLNCRNTTYSAANRKAYANLMRFGALDITKVDDFYTEDTGSFAEPPNRGESTAEWYTWVNITANPIERVNLVNSVRVIGDVPVSVNLLGDWPADIPA